jgi:hypothetical protein
MKYLKLFEHFFPQFSDDDYSPEKSDYTTELYNFIDSLKIEKYLKESLKESQDLTIIWNQHIVFKQGMKDLMYLFQQDTIDYYNDYIKQLEQDSFLTKVYDSVDDFIMTLDRVNQYITHPDKNFIMSQVLGYCNPLAIRYLSDECMKHILKNKQLINKFQALWVTPLTICTSGSCNFVSNPFGSKYRLTGVKPFVPTSDKEQEEKILEIVFNNYTK